MADPVIVNTCGFIDSAVQESLDTIGVALVENGPVIVTGCVGARNADDGGNLVRQMHPKVLAVTGPHATRELMDAVYQSAQVVDGHGPAEPVQLEGAGTNPAPSPGTSWRRSPVLRLHLGFAEGGWNSYRLSGLSDGGVRGATRP